MQENEEGKINAYQEKVNLEIMLNKNKS